MQSGRFVWIVATWVMLFTGPVTFARQQAVLADQGRVDVEQETMSGSRSSAFAGVTDPVTRSQRSGTASAGSVRATFMVTNTNDSGAGSLRQAILDTNASPNGSEPDEIHFNIDAQTDPRCDSGTGVCTIVLIQGLPVISEAVILDGETQPGADCGADIASRRLKVVLNGSAVTAGADGLILSGSGSTVRGLVIRDFSERGILISGGSNGDHIIACNFIGTDVTGTVAHANLKGGVRIQFGAANNIVGGTTPDAGNLISGNGADWWSGISLYASATGNRIEGNYIGIDATGTMPLGNYLDGISIIAATNNIVGGTTEGARNVISGNSRGIRMVNTAGNRIEGNYIGTDATGTVGIGNSRGLEMQDKSSDNIIGGTTAAARNIISSNTFSGIDLFGDNSTGNRIEGNYIGTDATGRVGLGNANGVRINGGATNNVIGGTSTTARNIISSSESFDVSIYGAGTGGNRIEGNYIGTDVTGADVFEDGSGILLATGDQNIIGGTEPGARNIIARRIHLANADNQVIQGNYVGINVTGTVAFDARTGIYIQSGSSGNLVGGIESAARNVISGASSAGVRLEGMGTDDNIIQGNYIGTDATGTVPIGNGKGLFIYQGAANNEIGGTTPNAGNVIAYSDTDGIVLGTDAGIGNAILGNSIFENGQEGIDHEEDGPTLNDSGDADTGPNQLQNFPDLTDVVYNESDELLVTYFVDTDPANATYPLTVEFFESDFAVQEGQVFLGRTAYSVADYNGCGTPPCAKTVNLGSTTIERIVATATDDVGNTSEFSRPVLLADGPFIVTNTNDSGAGSLRQAILDANASANNSESDAIHFDIDAQTDPGCDSSTGVCTIAVLSDLPAITEAVLLDGETQEGADCGFDIPSRTLKVVLSGAMTPFIEGLTITSSGSTIRGLIIQQFDDRRGILITGAGATDNTIACNFIGPDATGTSAPASNQDGIRIEEEASNNTIGGTTPDAGNLISGGNRLGILISEANNNQVLGNFIGTDRTGTVGLGNSADGVNVGFGSSNNVIGGTSASERNIISGNGTEGVQIQSENTTNNRVEGNFIGTDLTGTVGLGNGNIGVFIGNAAGNIIGGTTPGASNVIADNGSYGIHIEGSAGAGNRIEGNFIGTDVNGTADLGNSSAGISFFGAAHDNTIGGEASGAGNIIAFNFMGIRLASIVGPNNAFLGNHIFENALLGIDLSQDWVTPNDPGDPDTGPNNLQNFPDITNAVIDSDGDLLVTYLVDTDAANATYPLTIEFFEADADDQEGQFFLGRSAYTMAGHSGCGTPPCEATMNLGNAATLGVSEGDQLVATATDDEGNTSEFSMNSMVVASATRYVATDGSDAGNDCTDSQNPCATLPHAVSQANPGDTIDLAAGTYDGLGVLIEKALTIQGAGVVVE